MKWKIILGTLCFLIIGLPAHGADDTYIVKFNNSVQLYNSGEESMSNKYCSATYEELEEYLDMGIVEYYEPDYVVTLFEDFDNQIYASQWNLPEIKIEKAWELGCYGNEIRVGVIDSGCYVHSDLERNLLPGRNYTSDDVTYTTDNIGHGTYVSGIIAATCNDAYITGVAPEAKIVPLKCFDTDATTTTLMISNAIYDAVDVYDCDVINLSLGISESSITKTLELSVKHAIEKGCIVVAAVGNYGNSKVFYPANYENVIGVGSVGEGNILSGFSQRNDTVDVVAPGESIESVSIDGYNQDSGTSFSAPHVAAIAAIVKCIDENITAQEFEKLLKTTSVIPGDIDETLVTYYGYGLVNCESLINELLKETTVFLSPITDKVARVYNNSDAPVSAVGVVATYDNNRFARSITQDISVEPGKIVEIMYNSDSELTKIMLWNNLSDLQPLCKAQEYKKTI